MGDNPPVLIKKNGHYVLSSTGDGKGLLFETAQAAFDFWALICREGDLLEVLIQDE